MLLKSLLRTYLLDLSIDTFFRGIARSFRKPPSIEGRYRGPIQVGMRFSQVAWSEDWDDVDGEIVIYRDAIITRIRTMDIHNLSDLISFSYNEIDAEDGDERYGEDSQFEEDLEFYL